MIVHRDYRASSHSTIKIFDDRIEFYNPGKLFGNLTVDDLIEGHYNSQSRNKLIAKVFKEVGLIERYGSGIMRVFNLCKNHGIIEPVFEEKPNGFLVTILKQKLKETDDQKNDTDHDTDHGTDNVTDRVPDRVPDFPGTSTPLRLGSGHRAQCPGNRGIVQS